ncbi:MAG: regulatory protein RecX, partial [Clostridia bacterium]|nr:regulatory protein RecX [Clostridia bacterium]
GRQNKIHLHCDGAYLCTVDAEYWFGSPYAGVNEIEDLQAQAAFLEAVRARSAYLGGLRLLAVRDYAAKELVQKLITKGHTRDAALAACETLKEYGYLNDRRYAEHLAATLIRSKGMSLRSAEYELQRRGVDREIVREIAQGLDFDPVLRIIELLETRFSRSLEDEKGLRRTVAALQRLGYGWSDIQTALRRVKSEADFDET